MKGLIGAGVVVALVLALALAFAPGDSEANGGHGACDGGIVDISAGTYDASPDIVTGVCIKAGNTQLHNLYTTDYADECYDVEGIGTSTVTVTRKGEGRTCQGISHIDVLTSTPTPTPTPTPSATPTPIPSPSPTITPTPIDPSPTPTWETPSALPNTGGEPSDGAHISFLEFLLIFFGSVAIGGGLVIGLQSLFRK